MPPHPTPPKKETIVVVQCSCESVWLYVSECVCFQWVWCAWVCVRSRVDSVACLCPAVVHWYLAASVSLWICAFRHFCACCVTLSALTWHSNHLTSLVITIWGNGCGEFPGRDVAGLNHTSILFMLCFHFSLCDSWCFVFHRDQIHGMNRTERWRWDSQIAPFASQKLLAPHLCHRSALTPYPALGLFMLYRQWHAVFFSSPNKWR